MRLTNKLYAQHIGWHFKKHWQVQGRRVPKDTGAAAELLKMGVQVKTSEDVLNPKTEPKLVEIVGASLKPIPEDETHPNWHSTACHLFGDSNVLLGGLPQAQVLTNSIEINEFPRQIDEAIFNAQLPKTLDRSVQNAIFSSQLLDAQQVKLPKIKLADRPAYNLPRLYGISQERRNRLLMNKLLFEIEKLAGRSVTVRRKLIDNVTFQTSLIKDNDVLVFKISGDKLISSARPLDAIKGKFNGDLPDLYPMKSTVSMPKQHIYTENTFYPIRKDITFSHPHTIFTYFDKTIVGNVHGSEVSKTQFYGRSLLKAFVVAASRAKQLGDVPANGVLQKPIVVQCIQTDGQEFHFGVLQLNTLNLSTDSATKNYWFHRPSVELFSECSYQTGRPYLGGYNSEAFRILNAFYNNF
ncbi:large ribosomal subunit protein mL37 isoform X2 [Drosophila sulfurigaster albostrigata]|uniref:large ribosomal subunit protein mL37 isoform X2 n=1 Tax=Drosophila sulfurigaster albostrigata TaxID=89887 RepID=UPI002D21DDAB|nr:large ribosomal subunit protein mL37 isoform X2 [Drosophila sulfurigaster albostrigata]